MTVAAGRRPISRCDVVLAVTSMLLALSVYWTVVPALFRDWLEDPNFSHGLLVPFISAWLIWRRRSELAAFAPEKSSWPGVVLVLTGMALLVVGKAAGEYFTMRVSIPFLAGGLFRLVFGQQGFRRCLFALAFLFFMVPIPYIVYDAVAFPLKLFASWVGERVLELFRVPVFREGNIIVLPNLQLEVMDACSGIRSLASLVVLSTVTAHLFSLGSVRGLILVLCSVPVAIAANTLRIFVTGVFAYRLGAQTAKGIFHEFSGWALFLAGATMIVSVGASLRMGLRPPAGRARPGGANPERRSDGLASVSLAPGLPGLPDYGAQAGRLDVDGGGSRKTLGGVEGEALVRNAMTVDVEDYYMVSAFAEKVSFDSWEAFPSRVVDTTLRVLDVLDAGEVRATFFVLGWVADKHGRIVREIAARGHEVACHGYAHRLVFQMTRKEFVEDAKRAKTILEDALGRPIIGYRAPSFSVTPRNSWALEALAECGFRYDSSVFPIRHDRYGFPGFWRFPVVLELEGGGRILEVPPSTLTLLGMNIPVCGGGYLRLYPLEFTDFAIRRLNEREHVPAVLYVHPWELDPEQPRIRAGLLSRIRHYTNISQTEPRLRYLLERHSFAPVGEVFAAAISVLAKSREV